MTQTESDVAKNRAEVNSKTINIPFREIKLNRL